MVWSLMVKISSVLPMVSIRCNSRDETLEAFNHERFPTLSISRWSDSLRAFESHGCYSGGALKVGDKLAMFYTGNTRRPSDNQRVPYQNLAMFSLNGKLLSKRPLIENAPEGYTEHVRDPKTVFYWRRKNPFYLWCTARKPHRNSHYFLKWTILKIRLSFIRRTFLACFWQ